MQNLELFYLCLILKLTYRTKVCPVLDDPMLDSFGKKECYSLEKSIVNFCFVFLLLSLMFICCLEDECFRLVNWRVTNAWRIWRLQYSVFTCMLIAQQSFWKLYSSWKKKPFYAFSNCEKVVNVYRYVAQKYDLNLNFNQVAVVQNFISDSPQVDYPIRLVNLPHGQQLKQSYFSKIESPFKNNYEWQFDHAITFWILHVQGRKVSRDNCFF